MTEAEYLSSTDPAAMRTLLIERGLWVERKCRAFVEACRWRFDSHNVTHSSDMWGRIGWGGDAESNIDYWLNLPDCPDVPIVFRVALIRDIWGNPFVSYQWDYGPGGIYSIHERICWCNPDRLTYLNGLVPALAKAAVMRECEVCDGTGCRNDSGPNEWWPDRACAICRGAGVAPITGPIDPLRLAVLADALEEAGCTDDGILGHLRATSETCPECSGRGSVKATTDPRGLKRQECNYCSGTGTRPVSHIWTPSGGCWVLDLLLGGEKGGPAAVGQPPAHDRG